MLNISCTQARWALPPERKTERLLKVNFSPFYGCLCWMLAGFWLISAQSATVSSALSSETTGVQVVNKDVPPQQTASELPALVFAVRQMNYDGHWYANFGYYADSQQRKAFRARGQLCKLDPATGQTQALLDDPEGTVRDPQVHYDGQTILFSYRKGGTDHFHLYEIQADGTGLRQITEGPYDDLEPTYLPDGDILFVSSRCRRWVNCWLTQVAVMFRCDRQGDHLRQLSANIEHDNTPWPLPDGRILYTRWEYIDRSQVDYHHLWTFNPDGTGQMVYYGNLHPGTVMIDAKPIPGSDQIVAIFSPGHGQKEHAGAVTVVHPQRGPDDRSAAKRISRGDDFRDPYPLGNGLFLVAQGTRIVLMNMAGTTQEIFRLPIELEATGAWCHEPRPLLPRPKESILPSRVNYAQPTGRLFVADVHQGRNMKEVKPGEIRELLVMESLPKPINYTGGMEPLSFGGTFTLLRILGTVPVEPDGSAYFEAPAMRSLFLIALDERQQSVKRMQSFFSVMPGETTSCVGCHENRNQTIQPKPAESTLAMRRATSVIRPLPNIPDVYDFPRDIQPILDQHCVSCHNPQRCEGKVLLTGDRGPMYSHSYYTLTVRHQFVDGRNDPKSNLAPRSIGAPASPLMAKLEGQHYGVKLSPPEINLIRFWIEASAPYPGTYAALGSGMIGGYHENQQVNTDWDWPEAKAVGKAIERRCVSCHQGKLVLPRNLSDERDISFWRPDFKDPRLLLSRHLVFNLTHPERSLMLLAPLDKSAGGYGLCRSPGKEGAERAVFTDHNDADYQALLHLCQAGQRQLQNIRRFDMPDFKPTPAYVREMKRYGILPADLDPNRIAIDVYQTDRTYWDSVAGHVPP